MKSTLDAANGLSLQLGDDDWRLSWGEADWLGPIEIALRGAAGATPAAIGTADGSDDIGAYRSILVDAGDPELRASVRAYEEVPVIVFRAEAAAALSGFSSGPFERISFAWPALSPTRRHAGGVLSDTRSYAHQWCEFALPVNGSDTGVGFLFAPHRPPVVTPLLFIAPDGRTLLLASLDNFHEQTIAPPRDPEHEGDGIRCGWHGDLSEIPAGFGTDFAVWAAPSPRAAIETWTALLRRRAGARVRGRYADEGLGRLSYWTDNGAVYYYRTAPGCDYTETLERAVDTLEAQGIPVHGVQVDSWFYPHVNLRAVSPDGADLVPPTGMMRWEPREDLFPDGLGELRRKLGGRPLTFHSRHFSKDSPYFDEYPAWVDGDYAHPTDERLFARMMEDAASWGAITYEQDWLVETYFGIRDLRAVPGRARAWQEALDRAAGRAGLTLQWCMATAADFLQALSLDNLTSIRTSGDYRYLFDNGLNWVWFLHCNALARALGLNPYKDVFISHGKTANSGGEPYAEVESLLAALSSGPVGIGDEIGATDKELVMRTCREDGVLIKPDVPLAAVDRCFPHNCFLEPRPLIGECYSQHPAGKWLYVTTFNAWRGKEPIESAVDLADLGEVAPRGEVIAFDWRKRTCARIRDGWRETIAWQDWSYRVLCPLLPGEIAVIGDVSKYAPAGDRRVAGIRLVDVGVSFEVLGVPGSEVEIWGWSAKAPASASAWAPAQGRQSLTVSWDAGIWKLRVPMGATAIKSVSLMK